MLQQLLRVLPRELQLQLLLTALRGIIAVLLAVVLRLRGGVQDWILGLLLQIFLPLGKRLIRKVCGFLVVDQCCGVVLVRPAVVVLL